MTDPWYEVVPAETSLTQGDLLGGCRIIDWRPAAEDVSLLGWVEERTADVVVMTQACDLEHHKVSNVVLCPCELLSAYRAVWDRRMRQRNQHPSEKSWRRTLEDIAAGLVWNQALLDAFDHPDLGTEGRVIEFHEVFTVPRVYLERLYANRAQPRLRLRPPYREHLSQAFARFFMRVGLPQPVRLPV